MVQSLKELLQSMRLTSGHELTVGLVGYYGWGNYGDEMFQLVLEDSLRSIRFVHLHTMTQPPYFPRNFAKRLAAVDAVLIGGGDLLIPWTVSPLYWNPAFLRKPVFVHGVGVPTWGGMDEDCVSRYRDFLTHPAVKAIGTRDPESMSWIARHIEPAPSKLGWAPDIVCAADFEPFRTSSDDRIFGLVTRAHQQIKHDRLLEACELAAARGYTVHHIVLSIGRTQADDLPEAKQLPFPGRTIITRDSIDALTHELARCSVVASMKFHGCIAAVLMGIPTLALSKADKFVSFYKLLGQTDFLTHAHDTELADKLRLAMDSTPSMAAVPALKHQAHTALTDLGVALEQLRRD